MKTISNLIKTIAISFSIVSCSSVNTNFYRELGTKICTCDQILAEDLYYRKLNDIPVILDSVYDLETNRLANRYDSCALDLEKHLNIHKLQAEKLKKMYSEKDRYIEIQKGYQECYCDTCSYNKNEKLKSL